MSATNEWTEWHLTPKGWKRGTEKEDHATQHLPVPHDAVCTYRWTEYQSSSFSRVERALDLVSTSKNGAALAALLAQFGQCSERL
jgi:hypothetical protein